MKRLRFREEQIIGVLKEQEAGAGLRSRCGSSRVRQDRRAGRSGMERIRQSIRTLVTINRGFWRNTEEYGFPR